MQIKTSSGIVTVNKRSHYGQFLLGYVCTPAWTGASTLADVWSNAWKCKPVGVSWFAYGKICGTMVWNGVQINRVFMVEQD